MAAKCQLCQEMVLTRFSYNPPPMEVFWVCARCLRELAFQNIASIRGADYYPHISVENHVQLLKNTVRLMALMAHALHFVEGDMVLEDEIEYVEAKRNPPKATA